MICIRWVIAHGATATEHVYPINVIVRKGTARVLCDVRCRGVIVHGGVGGLVVQKGGDLTPAGT